MYKLTFTLKQHTPIIHFQHDQAGATLRASEVKPKLDKFIIEQMGGIDKIPKDWRISDQNEALNYKMRVDLLNIDNNYFLPLALIPNRERKTKLITFIKSKIRNIEILAPTSYFANENKIKWDRNNLEPLPKFEDFRIAVLSNTDINIDITSFNDDFIKIIKTNVSKFFLINNFGTRQNKGFGSFTVKSINGIDEVLDEPTLKKLFVKKSKNEFKSQNAIFQFILEEYNLLKSGQNRPYKKSEIFKYFVAKDIRWEKRFLKKKLTNNGVILKQNDTINFEPIDFDKNQEEFYNSYIDKQTNNYQYVRALLGLAENFEFALNRGGKLKVKVSHSLSTTHNEKIERFKSPIFFKIIGGFVYLAINESYKDIKGAEFEFHDNTTLLGKLVVPSYFDLGVFISKLTLTNWKNL